MLNFIDKRNKREALIKIINQQRQQKIHENQQKQQQILEENKKQQKIFEEEQKYNKMNINYILKDNYNSIIPLNLYTCWHTLDLPPLMSENYNLIIKNNPEFNHFLYDENMCRQFLIDNFDTDVIESYDSLIPCAYKADLWRYCILYKNGGIYLDIKYSCINNFKLISLTEKKHWVLDADKNGVYNALIVSKPGNEILLKAINKIVENVKNKFYGSSSLEPTGPLLLSLFFTQNEKNNFELYHYIINNEYYIVYNDMIILKFYNNYREEQFKNQKNKHYSNLWHNKNIFINK